MILIIAFGLIAGSFLGLCAYRLPRGQSLARPGSRCPACAHALGASENIPLLSFAWQGGKCRTCRRAIPWRYPAIEMAVAAAFAWSWTRTASSGEFMREAFFFACLATLIATDLESRQLPDEITLGGWAVGLIFAGLGIGPSLLTAAWASAIGAGSLALVGVAYQRWRGREGMGWGDIKMLGMMGAFLGLESGAVALALAAVAASAAGLLQASGVLIARLRRGDGWVRARAATALFLSRGALPFGVFLAGGAAAALAWGPALWRAWIGAH